MKPGKYRMWTVEPLRQHGCNSEICMAVSTLHLTNMQICIAAIPIPAFFCLPEAGLAMRVRRQDPHGYQRTSKAASPAIK